MEGPASFQSSSCTVCEWSGQWVAVSRDSAMPTLVKSTGTEPAGCNGIRR
ncbi:hypothetical protein ACFFX0_10445 [Citricoccus parietis]|uniref:Uncharacterized protein n=1 Tax=Citricoccus parietis TaxID=592307 RepID=A0ABV5FY66_9MICC